jgi:hypothetical protein
VKKEGSTKRGALRFALTFFFILIFSLQNVLGATVDGYTNADVKLPLYLLMMGLSFAFLFLGMGMNNPLLASVGLLLMFFGGMLMMNGHVLIPTGETIYKYGDNYNGYHYDGYNESAPPQLNDLNLFHTYEEYEAWDDGNNAFLGWAIVIISAVLMFTMVAGFNDD